jgi:hypothetical protein
MSISAVPGPQARRLPLAACAAVLTGTSFLPAVLWAQGPEPRVVDAFKIGYEKRTGGMTEEEYKESRGKAGLNEIVIVKVQNLEPHTPGRACGTRSPARSCST